MFKIGEFSKLTQVTIRMLRYYDEIGLLKPARTDQWTGYRMYSVEQIPVLNRIIYYRDSGFNVVEIAEALEKQDDYLLVEQLNRKYSEIEAAIVSQQEKLRKIEAAKREILNGKNEMHYQITRKSIPSYRVLTLRRIIPDYYWEGKLWKDLTDFASRQKIDLSVNTFSIYHDREYKDKGVDVELCAPVNKRGIDEGEFIYRYTEPVPNMASTMVYGPFSNIAGAYSAFANWLQMNSHYRMSYPTRQINHLGPWNESNPDHYLTEIQIPLESG